MGVSGNEGFLLSGPDNKDPTIWGTIWEFPKIRGTLFWVLIIRILLFRVLFLGGPLFAETPRSGPPRAP